MASIIVRSLANHGSDIIKTFENMNIFKNSCRRFIKEMFVGYDTHHMEVQKLHSPPSYPSSPASQYHFFKEEVSFILSKLSYSVHSSSLRSLLLSLGVSPSL